MKGTRKRYPASFKARVALEAAKQTKPLAELSGRYQVHSVQISQWKKQLLDGIESLFRDGRRRDHDESQEIQAELFEQIGRLKMELEWLKKKALLPTEWVTLDRFSEFRQHARKDFEAKILFVSKSVGPSLDDADLVVDPLDEAQGHLVLLMAIRRDSVPMFLDHPGKLLVRLEALPP